MDCGARKLAAAATATLAILAAACEPADGPRQVRSRPLPTGAVDVPSENAAVATPLVVEGWALADGDIDEVNVYLDGVYVGTALYGLERPDVAAAHPTSRAARTSGFRLTLSSVVPGRRLLTVQARSRRGATRDLASRHIQIVLR